jgi:hypothetical protein
MKYEMVNGRKRILEFIKESFAASQFATIIDSVDFFFISKDHERLVVKYIIDKLLAYGLS